VSTAIGHGTSISLLGMYSFTGCDTTCALAGKGKLPALKLLKRNPAVQDTCKELGSQWEVTEELYKKCEEFACMQYGGHTGKVRINQINDMHYHMFCTKKGDIESHQLPPCLDCLKKHIDRASFQAAIWRRALIQHPATPSPVGHGWEIETTDDGHDQLAIDWMSGSPAPNAVLEMLSCSCSKTCKAPDCPCVSNMLKCSDMCKLRGCENEPVDNDSDDELDY